LYFRSLAFDYHIQRLDEIDVVHNIGALVPSLASPFRTQLFLMNSVKGPMELAKGSISIDALFATIMRRISAQHDFVQVS
jgi:hypothetical protein